MTNLQAIIVEGPEKLQLLYSSNQNFHEKTYHTVNPGSEMDERKHASGKK